MGEQQPIRILHVIGQMDRGGAETMLMNLYRHIDRSLVQFDFVVHTNSSAAYDEEIVALGGRIYHCPKYPGKCSLHAYCKWWKNFFATDFQEHRVIHGHIGSVAPIYLSLAKRYGVITIAHSHSSDGGTSLKSILYRIAAFPTRYISSYFFGCSLLAGVNRYGRKVCQDAAHFRVLNNAVDSKKFQFNHDVREAVRSEFAISEDALLVGAVGRLTYPKNPHGIIDIFQAVHQHREDAMLLWVGDGDMRGEAEEHLERIGLRDRVIFTGVRSDVERLYQGMDVFIFPSFYEGLGIVAIEAQTAGLPTFCSDAVPREAGITDLCRFLPLGKPELWAEEILSADLTRRDMQQAVIDAGYDIQTTAKWLQEFYLDIAAGREPCRP